MLSVANTKHDSTTNAKSERLKKKIEETMANDVNLFKGNNGIELKTISAGSYHNHNQNHNRNHNQNRNQNYDRHKKSDLNCATYLKSFKAIKASSHLLQPPLTPKSSISSTLLSPPLSDSVSVPVSLSTKALSTRNRNPTHTDNGGRPFTCNDGTDIGDSTSNEYDNGNSNGNGNGNGNRFGYSYIGGCCGIFGRLLCSSEKARITTASSCHDFCLLNANGKSCAPSTAHLTTITTTIKTKATTATTATTKATTKATKSHSCLARRTPHRRTPQEIYFESRGKSCKKLLKFNGNCNKILLYPEEGWARTASSSYWTITPCWWQPNRCYIEEFSGTQRQLTKAKMLALDQQGSLLIAGHFHKANNKTDLQQQKLNIEEFKLYLSSNISMEDYNMGYCLTGFVERRSQPSNAFQMTHFAVIKRQWPSINNNGNSNKINIQQNHNYNCNHFITHMTTRRYLSTVLSNSCYTIQYNQPDKST